MDDLSDEHLLRVFAFLDARELGVSQLVCRRWRGLADDYTLWRGLCFTFRLGPDLPRLFSFASSSLSSSSSSSLSVSLSSSASSVPAGKAALRRSVSSEGPSMIENQDDQIGTPDPSPSPPHASSQAVPVEAFIRFLAQAGAVVPGEEAADDGDEHHSDGEAENDDGESDMEEEEEEEPSAQSRCTFMSKADFKLERFGFEAVPANWKCLYRRLRTRSYFVSRAYSHQSHPRLCGFLSHALLAADNGDYVYVLPGVYYCDETDEVLRMHKAVQVIGLGKTADDVVLKMKDRVFLRAWAVLEVCGGDNEKEPKFEGQAIKNITFMGSNNHAICIGEGSNVTIENCKFTNKSKTMSPGSATAVNIYGFATNPTMKDCYIYNSSKHGVFVGEAARATLINVEISGTEHSGAHVRSSGKLDIRGGKIHNCRHHGVFVNGAGATIRDCEIYNIKGKGIEFREGLNEVITENNNVHDCLEQQVGGTTSAEDCIVM